MSEELEAFNRVIDNIPIIEMEEKPNYTLEDLSNDTNLIKQALTELKQIKETNYSKALDKFDYIGNDIKFAYDDDYVSYDYTDDVEYIKNTLIKAQQQEKVLNAIFKKELNVKLFIGVLWTVGGRFEYKEYEKNYTKYGEEKLTEEEFNLVKERFKYD